MVNVRWTRRRVLGAAAGTMLAGPGCALFGPMPEIQPAMVIADSGTLDSPVALDASNVAYLLSQCPQWTTYEATRPRTKRYYDRVAGHNIAIGPAGERWRADNFSVSNADSNRELLELTAELADLRLPDFVAAGPNQSRMRHYVLNDPIVIARGSKVVVVKHCAIRGSDGRWEQNAYGFAVDFAALVGPERKDHRIFLDVQQAAIVYLLPWRDDAPVSSLSGYSMSLQIETGLLGPPTPIVSLAEHELV
jgi:hypothetical protein